MSSEHFNLSSFSKELICSHDENGFIIEANPGAFDLFEIKRGDFVGRKLEELINPSDRVFQFPKLGTEGLICECKIETINKPELWVEVKIQPVSDAGEIKWVSITREITSKKVTESQLKSLDIELKERNHSLENLTQAVYQSAIVSITNLKGIIIDVNQEFLEISGYSRDELIGENHRILNSGYHSKDFWKSMWATVGRGKRWRAEVRNRAKDGSYYWVDTVINPILDINGKIIRYFSIRNLISDKVEQREELTLTREQLQETNKLANVGGWQFDIVNQRFYWSDLLREIFEVKSSYEPTEKSVYHFIDVEHRARVERCIRGDLEKESHFKIEFPIITPNENRKWLSVRGKVVKIKGKAIRINGAAQDITESIIRLEELEKLKSRIKLIMDESKTGWWENNLQTNEFIYSDSYAKLMGTSETLTMDNVWEFSLEEDREKLTDQIENSLQQNKPFNLEHRIKTKTDGKIKWVHVTGFQTLDDRGFPHKIMGITYDISDLKSIEGELKRKNTEFDAQNKELRKINKELDSFVYRVSHDLRAPITSALGLASLSLKTNKLNDLHQYADLQIKSLEKLDKFIIEILDFSRNARLEVKSESVDFHQILESLLAENKYSIEHNRIQVNTDISVDDNFQSDDFRINIILRNLLSNALKFYDLEKEDRKVDITLRSENKGVNITVWDNGIGINKDYVNKIFTMFFRATDQNHGSGLGLYIVKDSIEKIEGKISVKTKEKEFTQFEVYLPSMAKN